MILHTQRKRRTMVIVSTAGGESKRRNKGQSSTSPFVLLSILLSLVWHCGVNDSHGRVAQNDPLCIGRRSRSQQPCVGHRNGSCRSSFLSIIFLVGFDCGRTVPKGGPKIVTWSPPRRVKKWPWFVVKRPKDLGISWCMKSGHHGVHNDSWPWFSADISMPRYPWCDVYVVSCVNLDWMGLNLKNTRKRCLTISIGCPKVRNIARMSWVLNYLNKGIWAMPVPDPIHETINLLLPWKMPGDWQEVHHGKCLGENWWAPILSIHYDKFTRAIEKRDRNKAFWTSTTRRHQNWNKTFHRWIMLHLVTLWISIKKKKKYNDLLRNDEKKS